MILVKCKCRRYLKVFIVAHEVIAVWASTKPAITKAITTLGPLQRHNLGQNLLLGQKSQNLLLGQKLKPNPCFSSLTFALMTKHKQLRTVNPNKVFMFILIQ